MPRHIKTGRRRLPTIPAALFPVLVLHEPVDTDFDAFAILDQSLLAMAAGGRLYPRAIASSLDDWSHE